MIKFKYDNGEGEIAVEGTYLDLLTGTSAFIIQMYRSLRGDGEDETPEFFLYSLRHLLTDDNSPLLKKIEEERTKPFGEVQ